MHSKRSNQQTKRQPTEWEKIFANSGKEKEKGVNFQNIQTARTTQYQKIKQLNKKNEWKT